MGKKRKSISTRLDEVDRSMYASFCGAANSLSQLYSQAMNHQKLSFQAGERHGLEKLYQWILHQQEIGSRVALVDILSYLQNGMDYCGDEPSMSSRALAQNHQHHQHQMQLMNAGLVSSGGSFGHPPAPTAHGTDNQTKNSVSVFSDALSSPVRQSLQPFHLAQGGGGGDYTNAMPPTGNNAPRGNEISFLQHIRDSNHVSSNDSSMDMHQDSPGPESNF